MEYFENILDAVGHTPLVRMNRVMDGATPLVLAKLENFNPGGSVKDRIGLAMVEAAEKDGRLRPGGTIIEPTSGNTGVGLAMVAAIKGYRAIFTIPDKMAQEKINLLKAYGARVMVTPTAVPPDSPESYYQVAERVHRERPNSVVPNQYANPMNPEAHYRTTGPEIWEQTAGKVTHFVCGIGTGGTISGVGRYLKEQDPKIKVIGVDPMGSILADYFRTREKGVGHIYKVEGIGEDIIPETVHFEYVDEVEQVTDRDSFLYTRRLAREEGILVGGSAGAALAVASRVARRGSPADVIVVLFPDTGERYLSKAHSEEWLKENGFLEESPPLVDIMEGKDARIPTLVTVEADEPVMHAVQLMRQHTVSQLPVLEEGRVVGSVREEALLGRMLQQSETKEAIVRDVMEPPFPVVGPAADLDEVSGLLLRGSPAVLLGSVEDPQGIVTRIDVVEYLSRRAAA
ncbi:MAG: cystathionine beta-synthase [Thermoplasmata archaeon]|nr:cystathionine beta-synthase [Thermoplasmata archaeon]